MVSMTKHPPGARWSATLRKQATWAACVVRFMIVLKTRYATENVPSTRVVAKSPIVTPIASPPGLSRIRATIARDRSMPWTGTPRSARGSATRPVPTPSSSARPPAASPASSSAIGARVSGWNSRADGLSYVAATRSPK